MGGERTPGKPSLHSGLGSTLHTPDRDVIRCDRQHYLVLVILAAGVHAACVSTRVEKRPHLLTLVTSSPTSSTMPMNSAGQHKSIQTLSGSAHTQHGSANGLADAANSCMGSFKVALLRPATNVCDPHTTQRTVAQHIAGAHPGHPTQEKVQVAAADGCVGHAQDDVALL